MAAPFADTKPYDVQLVDATDGEEWTVTMRPLNAGHQAQLLDQLAVEESGDSVLERPRIGTMKLLLVNAAVVKWTLSQPPTPDTIAQLRPDLFEQLYDKARFAGDELENPTEAQASGTSPEPTSETPPASAEPVLVDAS